ncbi:hypothetical protein BDV29DRAFT_163691 [Aspergillus leporis]|uniref:Uncharacterized protein n=1 Tax=Aspergillus leporis TaxID=41062 RepID=A0A5N5WGF1_9EURO|nr:hypothetical protein BDV29DRAFT_163691 [Aspergillus leporis]
MNTNFLFTIFTITITLVSSTGAAPAPTADEGLVIIGSPSIKTDWTESSFLQCVKQLNGFKSANIVDDDIALKCRGVYGNGGSNLLHGRSVKATDRCPARPLPSTSEVVEKHSCAKDLPKNFEEAAPFRAAVDTVCNDLVGSLLNKGMNHITHRFADASTKSASWLLRNKDVLLEVTMNLTPQTRSALKAGKVVKATLDNLCKNGLRDFGTKDKGCTNELKYYKKTLGIPHHGIPYDQATTTGVTDGVVDLFVNNAKDLFGTINLSWSKPK